MGDPAEGASLSGFNRRVPGAQLPTATAALPDMSPSRGQTVTPIPARDAELARSAMDAYQAAVERATGAEAALVPGRQLFNAEHSLPGTLVRRVPGANLAPNFRDRLGDAANRVDGAKPLRDAEASRAAFDGYATGLSRAAKDYPRRDRFPSEILFEEGEHS